MTPPTLAEHGRQLGLPHPARDEFALRDSSFKAITWSSSSRRQLPTQCSTRALDASDLHDSNGGSTSNPYLASRSKMRYLGVDWRGNDSRNWFRDDCIEGSAIAERNLGLWALASSNGRWFAPTHRSPA
jgi:hypothetical protein